MGMYFNPGNDAFQSILNDTYVDKTGLIEEINYKIDTPHNLFCVSRPRRFGKTFAAMMLCAYYDASCESRKQFENLEIAKSDSFEKHLNKYNVLYLDIGHFVCIPNNIENILQVMQNRIVKDLARCFPDIIKPEKHSVIEALYKVVQATGRKFVIIIDEWDILIREEKNNGQLYKDYILRFLRSIFKNGNFMSEVVAGGYMTGILPIKKYSPESCLNNFYESTAVNPGKLAPYFGFSKQEVKQLCEKYNADFADFQTYFDGYSFKNLKHIYNPYTVMRSMESYSGKPRNYWIQSETILSLKNYVSLDFEGLKESIMHLSAGNRIPVCTNTFLNDFVSFHNADDVLTPLIHLGYLTFDSQTAEAYIPNKEISDAFETVIDMCNW